MREHSTTSPSLRRRVLDKRWALRLRMRWLVVVLSAALVISATGVFAFRDHLWGVRAEARTAIRALKDRDLPALEKHLAANRGRKDFAYFFASQVTPRDLGDALSSVAGESDDKPLKVGVDKHAYELALTDLAGTLALATHGAGNWMLPDSWTTDFVSATTTPIDQHGGQVGFFSSWRDKQDQANKANLLLLLARGYWSSEFLQAVTAAYYDFDHRLGEDAWPDADPSDGVGYAPAPTGAYLTDGILALTAALTANPAASEWAFTDFRPGTKQVNGSAYRLGRFAHFLMFEHQFPETSGTEGIGMTATLTALSSAIDSASLAGRTYGEGKAGAAPAEVGPMRDSVVLQALVRDLTEQSGCSFNPLDYGHCVIDSAKAVWRWVQRWGHLVLDILSQATFVPPPFAAVAIAAAALNATWYAVAGDYGKAGLSLSAVLPGLNFAKIARRATTTKDATTATKAAHTGNKSEQIATVAKHWRPMKPWRDCDLAAASGGLRVTYGPRWTRAQRRAADEKMKAISEAARRGELVKTKVERSATTASSTYRKSTGKTIPQGHDVDHTVELQLGGKDDTTNMKPLDKAVNSSIGRQIEAQLRGRDYGSPIPSAAIC